MIGSPATLTTSGQRYHHFGPLYSINNDTEYLQTVIAALRIRQNSVCKCCGRIGHKADVCIICGPKFLLTNLIRKTNQFNNLHCEKTTKQTREWISQLPEDHFKYSTSPTNTSTVVSDIMGRLNHHAIDNGYVEVHASKFLIEFNSEYVTDPYTNPIK